MAGARKARGTRPGISLELIGARELGKAFEALAREEQERIIMPALEEGANVVLRLAKQKAPVRTGKLRDTMYTVPGSRSKRGRKWAWYVRTGKREALGIPPDEKFYYPMVVEYGGLIGARATTALGALARVLGDRSKVHDIPAHPYMRPAADEAKPTVVGIIWRHVESGMDRVVREKMGGK